MTVTNKMTDKESLAAYFRFLRKIPRLLPASPNMGAQNSLLPDTADDLPNQLPSIYQGRELVVEVPMFTVPVPLPPTDGQVSLVWDGVEVTARTPIKFPLDPTLFPLKLMLPAAQTITPGTHLLTYRLFTGNTEFSFPLEVSIDITAPNAGSPGAPIVLPPEVELNGITREYLDANGSVLLTIPPYGDAKINDEINIYYGSILPGVKIGTIIRDDLTKPTTLSLTNAQVGTTEGSMFLSYTLTDRVGNVGQQSFRRVDVILRPAPANLKPPTVPQDQDAERITLLDAQNGVGIVIAEYDNFSSGDQVMVTWDGAPQPAIALVGFPAIVTLNYATVRGSNEGPKTVHISYDIVRGNRTFPEPIGVDVQVDLRKPGPPDPDPETPVNPHLELVVVQARVTPSPNKIGTVDKGLDADASVELYDMSKADDVMQLYWKGVEVPAPGGVYTVLGTEAPGFIVNFVIPWATIDAGGNDPVLPVHYTIAHPDVNGNVDTSPPQSVEVLAIEHIIPKPLFQNLSTDVPDFMNCDSLRFTTGPGWHAEVLVAGGEPQLANQELLFTYQGWTSSDGTTPIAGNTLAIRYTPTTEEAANGFVVRVPYAPLLETYNRWGSIKYSAVIDGFPSDSERHLVRVYMQLVDGNSCRLNPSP